MTRNRFLKLATYTGAGSALTSCQSLAGGGGRSAVPDYAGVEGADLITERTPLQDGFSVPGEWAPHAGTIMVFVPAQNWRGHGLDDARKEWVQVAHTVAGFEPVTMVVDPADKAIADRLLSEKIRKVYLPVNDGWARDSGPTFLKNAAGEKRVAGFTFNGWGAKFPPYADDALLKVRLAKHFGTKMYVSDIVLEGGGVLQDGEGTLIATEQCLLHRNRNPGKTKEQVERGLLDYYGARKVIWLPKGLTPDPITDGHVDGLAAFARPGVVLLHTTTYKSDPNFRRLQDAKATLEAATDAGGRKLRVIELPLAENVAHMNFYVCNGGVVVPLENKPDADEPAMEILREAFPGRRVVGVSGVVLSKGGGGIHCITQQIPA